MLNRLIKHKRFRDVCNFKEFECRLSLVITIIFLLMVYCLRVYDNINHYIDLFSTLLTSFVEAFAAMAGIILSGVAIISGLFSGKLIFQIGFNRFEAVLSSFEYIGLHSALTVPFLISIQIALVSPLPIVPVPCFYVTVFIITYIVLFNILYSVALIGNCIDLYKYKSRGEIIEQAGYDKRIIDLANEIRIDLLYHNLYNGNMKKMKDDIINNIRDMDISLETKNALMTYLDNYYNESDG